MPKKPEFIIDSYGRYTTWNKNSHELPKILEFTDTITADDENEFGLTHKIIGGKGVILKFVIEHPPIKNEKNQNLPNFTGKIYVKRNNFECFIGDRIQPPFDKKKVPGESLLDTKKNNCTKIFYSGIDSKNVVSFPQ